LRTHPSQPNAVGTIRLAGGLFTTYMKNGKTFATRAGMAIGAVVEDTETDFVME
jgi:hypothetical protein